MISLSTMFQIFFFFLSASKNKAKSSFIIYLIWAFRWASLGNDNLPISSMTTPSADYSEYRFLRLWSAFVHNNYLSRLFHWFSCFTDDKLHICFTDDKLKYGWGCRYLWLHCCTSGLTVWYSIVIRSIIV